MANEFRNLTLSKLQVYEVLIRDTLDSAACLEGLATRDNGDLLLQVQDCVALFKAHGLICFPLDDGFLVSYHSSRFAMGSTGSIRISESRGLPQGLAVGEGKNYFAATLDLAPIARDILAADVTALNDERMARQMGFGRPERTS